ncbi:BCCT family transporter [Shewanella sp. NIFS-20-20]|uniref:BCCT family transporter n=1 Tax=Shewanella sp. NIFS-20-20 TaxID=2853806 RepID=UPI001C48468E|nr:BCCT family transporter [Shewanella sp. NIFS-20-20]MBV7316348.1 BCCT family transporter [Shewanella sp. NIFS-20-20]
MSPDGEVNPIDTDYRVGQDNIALSIGPFGLDFHNRVFIISTLLSLVVVIITLMFQQTVEPAFTAIKQWITSSLDWFFLSTANIILLVCLSLVLSPLGRVRIGGTQATPDYGYIPWFSMLFAAGMGIGLMFFGVAEPISHYSAAVGGPIIDHGLRVDMAPMLGALNDPSSAQDIAMASTILHWGLHPWAIYSMLGLSLAIFSFNKGLPLTVRSIFYPLLGERIWGWPGHIIDILAVVATLFGLATSLGFGASQAAAGLNYLFGVPLGTETQIILVFFITAMALISVWAGLNAGVKRLSEINMGLAALLLLFVVFVGPTLAIITGFADNLLSYLRYLPELSMPFNREDSGFTEAWTAFYWAWWISWSPFVAMFIARVSRGRSVREFVTCVLLIPSTACVLWMTVFGNTAIDMVVNQGYQALIDAELPLKLFTLLHAMPLSSITSFIGIVLVVIFFVTSADSGSLVIDTIAAGGKTDAPRAQRVYWCSFQGIVAIVLILGGGLTGLQAMTVSAGLPFALILLVACVSLIKGLLSEPRPKHKDMA